MVMGTNGATKGIEVPFFKEVLSEGLYAGHVAAEHVGGF